MNASIKLGALLFVMAMAAYQKVTEEKELPSAVMDNVEALASGESGGYYYCEGYGCVDCPDGTKAKYVGIGRSLIK